MLAVQHNASYATRCSDWRLHVSVGLLKLPLLAAVSHQHGYAIQKPGVIVRMAIARGCRLNPEHPVVLQFNAHIANAADWSAPVRTIMLLPTFPSQHSHAPAPKPSRILFCVTICADSDHLD